jgi:hypothetical protein
MASIKKICESPLNLKIISFFRENPSAMDTSRGIAGWLNHPHEEVKKVLDYLVAQKILIVHRTGATTAYAYTQDKKIIEEIEKVL